MDLSPLRGTADFRWLFSSRTVTLLGTEASAVALLVQAKQLTGSASAVGLLGVAELVPLAVFGLYGGVLADRLDRSLLLRWGEAGLGGAGRAAAGQRAAPAPVGRAAPGGRGGQPVQPPCRGLVGRAAVCRRGRPGLPGAARLHPVQLPGRPQPGA